MLFNTTSRKDDFISLTYLLLTVLNHFQLPTKYGSAIQKYDEKGQNVRSNYLSILEAKKSLKLGEMTHNMHKMILSGTEEAQ